MSKIELPIAGQGAPEASSARLIITLGLAGTIAGFALAGAFALTKPIIDANKARALARAVFEVVPGSQTMQKLVVRDGKLVIPDPDDKSKDPAVYAAYDGDGRFVGYAIEGAGAGFQDTIRILFGYDPARRQIIGMYVLESRETPGLGDKIIKDADFVANFADLAVDPRIKLVKGGRSANNEVDAITGATISSRAVVKIVNAAFSEWQERLPPPGQEPPAPRAAETGEDGDG